MFEHKSVFFKDFGSVLISWLKKMHVTHKCTHAHTHATPMYTCSHRSTHKCMGVCMYMCMHTHTHLFQLWLSPCFHYIPINSQNNFFTNCVLSRLCSLWLPVLIRIKDKALSLAINVLCDLTFNSSALAVYPTLCLWSPATGVSLLFFPQAKLISIPELFVSLKCSLLMAGSSLFVVTPSLRKAIPYHPTWNQSLPWYCSLMILCSFLHMLVKVSLFC